MTKTELRHQFLKRRLSLSQDDVDVLSRLICERFFTLGDIRKKEVFHIFLPIVHNKEINTWPIIENLWEAGKKVVVPVSDFTKHEMSNFYLEKGTPVQENRYGIPEPCDAPPAFVSLIDVVILPLLAFDAAGYRVGYGKGFYDRFINGLTPQVVKIGLSFFEPVDCINDVGEWDQKLDYCITPNNVYSF